MRPPALQSHAGAFLRTVLLLLLMPVCAFSQGFSLTVTPTDETCAGNGTLTFTIENPAPGASYSFLVYQLPDLINPIASQTSTFLGGRNAGTYRVFATENLNGVHTTQSVDVTINANFAPFSFDVAGTPAMCGSDGSISVNVTEGAGTLYEIINGPVTRPPQTSPLFENLPPGVYEVRVFDHCNNAWVVTHTILGDPVNLSVSSVTFPSNQLPACDQIIVGNEISGSSIPFPLTATYTIHPPTGADIQITTVFNGSGTSFTMAQVIPFYYDTVYSYDLIVIDACGNTWVKNNNIVNKKIGLTLAPELLECGMYMLTVIPMNHTDPVMVEIASAPEGFDPALNPGHPGPFSGNIGYGDNDNPIPEGDYTVRILDGCGRTAENTVTVVFEPVEPVELIEPLPGCQSNFSNVTITVPGRVIVEAMVIDAPAGFGETPLDVSLFIDEDEGLVLSGLIEGHYVVHLVDECGDLFVSEFDVPPLNTSVSAPTRPDCEIGKGTIRVRGNGMLLTSASVTSGPPEFSDTYPVDVTSFISSDGILSLADLPPGPYTIIVHDECGDNNTVVVNQLPVYQVSASEVTVTPHCGSFDLYLSHSSNATSQSFWLQKLNVATGEWGHPDTGAPYPEGTWPNNTNSIQITNNNTTYNLAHLGTFRIIKRFEAFGNGGANQLTKSCLETIDEFVFDGSFQITGFQKLTCDGSLADIQVFANGVEPMTYKIVEKNGEPFVVDNGQNNIFTGLEPAVYTFQVQQYCGDIQTEQTDVSELPALAVATQPDDLVACDDSDNDGIAAFDLTEVNATVLNGGNPADFSITYHLTEQDAILGTNSISSNFTSQSATIYLRMVYLLNSGCVDITHFDLVVNPFPVSGIEQTAQLCGSQPLTLNAGPGFSSYQWSTGHTSQSISVSSPGTYSVTVSLHQNGVTCSETYSVEVTPAQPPTVHEIQISDWTDNRNSISVILSNETGDYLYSLDNIHFQDSNTFDGLLPGLYTVYVTDPAGCYSASEDVYLLHYPRFFTPNGDGYNDYWKVKFAEAEPPLMTYIYDRYGKLLTGFGTDSPGWDGTLNGQHLPSTDYWFVVVREDGRIHRGHFSMKR